MNGSDYSIIKIISKALSGVTINLSNGYVWPGYILADFEDDFDEIDSVNANKLLKDQLEEQNFENSVILLSNRVLTKSEAQLYAIKGVNFLQETTELSGAATPLKIARSSMRFYEKNFELNVESMNVSSQWLERLPIQDIEIEELTV